MADNTAQPPRSPVTDSPVEPCSNKNSEAYLNAMQSKEARDEGPKDDNNLERKRKNKGKLETLESTSEHQKSVFHENLKQTTEASSEKHVCKNTAPYGGISSVDGKTLEKESGVPLQYINKRPRTHSEELKKILHDRKLYLVLDLDYTLLDSTQLVDLSSDEEYLKSNLDSQTNPLQVDVSKARLFVSDHLHMVTKLRPFVRTFLKEATRMFNIYVYTMNESYASEMVDLLDPRSKYFSDKILQDNSTQKGLNFLSGQSSTAILIFSEAENVWPEHKDNLILMQRYLFFASSCRQFHYKIKSLAEMKEDESELDGVLAAILKVLRQIHTKFFRESGDDDHASRDVRQILQEVRKEILKGCKIVFNCVSTDFQADNHRLWKSSEQLGATCVEELDTSVTHVVSTDYRTEKSAWAIKEKKFLVNPWWIEAAVFLWQRQPEEKFPVNVLKRCKIVFSGVFPSNFRASSHRLWKMAKQFGATCSKEFVSSVTHVVSADYTTVESYRALNENKFLVNQRWLEDTNILWRRQPENMYPVNILKGCKIVLSGFILTNNEIDGLWNMAEQLGAKCFPSFCASVTHVVSENPTAKVVGWARKRQAFLVRPRWIEDAKSSWTKQPEEGYLVS